MGTNKCSLNIAEQMKGWMVVWNSTAVVGAPWSAFVHSPAHPLMLPTALPWGSDTTSHSNLTLSCPTAHHSTPPTGGWLLNRAPWTPCPDRVPTPGHPTRPTGPSTLSPAQALPGSDPSGNSQSPYPPALDTFFFKVRVTTTPFEKVPLCVQYRWRSWGAEKPCDPPRGLGSRQCRWQSHPGLSGLQGQCPSCHTPAASEINLKEAHLLSNGSCTGSRAERNICFLIPALHPELHGINPSPWCVAGGSSAWVAKTVVIQVQWTLSSPGSLGLCLDFSTLWSTPWEQYLLLDFCAFPLAPDMKRCWLNIYFTPVSVTCPSAVDPK